jgi:RimJ/RimL family protein N-acetyltransferase
MTHDTNVARHTTSPSPAADQLPGTELTHRSSGCERAMVTVARARIDWLEALTAGDDTFTARFGIAVEPGWIGFPDALAPALASTRGQPDSPWGTHLIFDDTDGALVGFGGFKGPPPTNGHVEIGYAVAPARRGRGIATAAVAAFVERARRAGIETIIAHTLASENPSMAVLRKSGFRRVAELPDDDLDLIWRWELAPGRAPSRTSDRAPNPEPIARSHPCTSRTNQTKEMSP